MGQKLLNQNHDILTIKDSFYEDDIWDLKKHFFLKFTSTQQKTIGKKGTFKIFFTDIENIYIRKEFKFFLYEHISKGIWNPSTFFGYRHNFKTIIEFFNERMAKNKSVIDKRTKEKLLDNLNLYLIQKGVVTTNKGGHYTRVDGSKKEIQNKRTEFTILGKFHDYISNLSYARQKEIPLKDKDIWKISELKLTKDQIGGRLSVSSLNFSQIKQNEMKSELKEYILSAKNILKLGTIDGRLLEMKRLSNFLEKNHPNIKSFKQLNRKIIEDFYGNLELENLQASSKRAVKSKIKSTVEGMIDFRVIKVEERLFYKEDFNYKIRQKPPTIISNEILKKLNEALEDRTIHLPLARMIVILQYTGVRITDLCLLQFGSITQDSEGDYHFKIFQNKTSKWVSIPIDESIAFTVLKQEEETGEMYPDSKYVFVNNKGNNYTQNIFSSAINRIARKYNITDEHGNVYRFKAHDFRRTKATSLMELGVSSQIISKFLGHANIETLKHYAKISDPIVEAAVNIINQYEQQILDITFDYKEMDESEKQEMVKQEAIPLPNGFCGSKEECKTAFACYRCPFFKPHRHFLKQYERQLELAKQSLQVAKLSKLERQVDTNEQLVKNIEKVIKKVK